MAKWKTRTVVLTDKERSRSPHLVRNRRLLEQQEKERELVAMKR